MRIHKGFNIINEIYSDRYKSWFVSVRYQFLLFDVRNSLTIRRSLWVFCWSHWKTASLLSVQECWARYLKDVIPYTLKSTRYRRNYSTNYTTTNITLLTLVFKLLSPATSRCPLPKRMTKDD